MSPDPTDEGPARRSRGSGPARHLAFRVEYDGSRFHGFQYQPRIATVQGELMRVFRSLLGPDHTLRAAGRTDRGVHALGQVVSVRSSVAFRWERLLELANDRLSPYVRLRSQEEKPYDFHPRYQAILRHYRFCICEDPSRRNTTTTAYATFAPGPLDWERIADAARRLEGQHSFVSFCTRPIDQPRLMRRLERIELSAGTPFRFVDFYGRSFLRGMVRNITGWLIAIGTGRYPPGVIDDLLARPVKDVSVRPAAPEGLYLVRIWYPGDPLPDWYEPPPAWRPDAGDAAPAVDDGEDE